MIGIWPKESLERIKDAASGVISAGSDTFLMSNPCQ